MPVQRIVQPVEMARFLRDSVEAATAKQLTVREQTKSGWVWWADELSSYPEGISSPIVEQPDQAWTNFLAVERPDPVNQSKTSTTTADEYSASNRRGDSPDGDDVERTLLHKRLYEHVFEARTPPYEMELSIGVGLLVGPHEKGPIERHLLTAPAEISLADDGKLRVSIADSLSLEPNWLPADLRDLVIEAAPQFDEACESVTLTELQHSLAGVVAHLGSRFSVTKQRPSLSEVGTGYVLAPAPAVMLRRRDTSSLLQLLKDMTQDLEDGGEPTEAFKMLLDATYRPKLHHSARERPALALPANNEQRALIERAQITPHMVIQGPPGTGKTHTIANLASILLAQGKRVLITAENDQAVSEVQNKLPEDMRPLMLPMFKGGNSSRLSASVNQLLAEAAANELDPRALERRMESLETDLDNLDAELAAAESKLRQMAAADRETRTIGGHSLTLAGHLVRLANDSDRLALIDRLLSEDGTVADADIDQVRRLRTRVSSYDIELAQFRYPENLPDPANLAEALHSYQRELSLLGEVERYDYADLPVEPNELSRMRSSLTELPTVAWSEILHSTREYEEAAEACAAASSDVNHGVVITGGSVAHAIKFLEAWLDLDPTRYPAPPSSLVSLVENLDTGPPDAGFSGAQLRHDVNPVQLAQTAVAALDTLDADATGLLVRFLFEQLQVGSGPIAQLVAEAAGLAERARFPLGPPVVVNGSTSTGSLRRQARDLVAHLAGGGKLTGRFGTPKPVREAQSLLETVQVGGSPIGSLEDAQRALEILDHHAALDEIESWAHAHGLRRPESLSVGDWLIQISNLPRVSGLLLDQLRQCHDGFLWNVQPPGDPRRLATAARSAAGQAVVGDLRAFADAQLAFDGVVKVWDGGSRPVETRHQAATALTALRAAATRMSGHHLLPVGWTETVDPLDVEAGDRLVDALLCAALAARFPPPARRSQLSAKSIDETVHDVNRHTRRREVVAEHRQEMERLDQELAACIPCSPATGAVRASLSAANPHAYREAVERLAEEQQRAHHARAYGNARKQVEDVHPLLWSAISVDDPDGINALDQLGELQQLRDSRRTIRQWEQQLGSASPIHTRLAELHSAYSDKEAELAGIRCWAEAIGRLHTRPELGAALSALANAVGRIPKTRTAKSFAPRMKALRLATELAAPAIPCWVMAIDRLAETLGYPEQADRFDTVIVDEASQAWMTSAFLYNIAHQIIVVGDDLQTSPSSALRNEDELRSIARAHIVDHPISLAVGSDLSLYDIASSMTAPEAMVDHFRCVPEIIEISNRLCYGPKGKRLRPARVPESNSLDPVRWISVNGHRRSAAAANEAEVEAIVDAVVQCHLDPRYHNMSFGCVVVGPQPNAHLKALHSSLLDRLGPDAMERRQVEVGTAAQFQGSERHVMFLSLVEARRTGQRIRKWPLEYTGRNRTRVQQLNVAASRARDQLWIFHSFELADLDPSDARVALLERFDDVNIDLSSQLNKCDSQFEKDVVTAIAELDPKVRLRTQVPAIGYLLDIVLEDPRTGNRLAVECDGDRWHSEPADVRRDLFRQRTLESVGWKFHRFLASEWYGDPAGHARATLESLNPNGIPTVSHDRPSDDNGWIESRRTLEPHTTSEGTVPSRRREDLADTPSDQGPTVRPDTPSPHIGHDGAPPMPEPLTTQPSASSTPNHDREIADRLCAAGIVVTVDVLDSARRLLHTGATVDEVISQMIATPT